MTLCRDVQICARGAVGGSPGIELVRQPGQCDSDIVGEAGKKDRVCQELGRLGEVWDGGKRAESFAGSDGALASLG